MTQLEIELPMTKEEEADFLAWIDDLTDYAKGMLKICFVGLNRAAMGRVARGRKLEGAHAEAIGEVTLNLTEYLAKWQELTGRQRDILTALALGYTVRRREGVLWEMLSPDGMHWGIANGLEDLWKRYCPPFTRFDPDCGAFVEVWGIFRKLSSEAFHQSRIAFGQEWRQSEKESCNAYHFWVELIDNPADALCCAYVWARLEEEPELWKKFEEATG